MSLYNVEIFKPDYTYRASAQVEEISYEFDYLSLQKNKIKLRNITAVRGDFIRIIKGSRKIFGLITGVSESDTITIEYMSILSMFDVDIYADVLSLISSESASLEDWIANTINSTFIKNADTLQNIPGMIIDTVTSTTGKKRLGFDSNIFNLYDLITKSLTQHGIVIDTDLDVQNKNIVVTICKRKDAEKHIEADLPNILDKELSIEKGREATNKMMLVNEDNTSEQAIYYLLQDGTVSNAPDSDKRITPVVLETKFISVSRNDTFADKAYSEAISKLVPGEYDNYICITVENDDCLVKPDEWLIGQKAVIIHNGKEYHSMLTGIDIGKRTKLMFGAVRKELTKKLKRRDANER